MTARMTTAPFLTSPVLAPVRHGFFTRQGGTSLGVYDSLNCGPGSGDDPLSVVANRALVAERLGSRAAALCTLYQVHGADVATVKRPWLPEQRPRADALVTDRPGLVLGILTADCGPVLFADPASGVIGAAHAGWKGALGGVLAATVTAMEALGAKRSRIRAVLGPTIAGASYEVSADLHTRFREQDERHDRFFTPSVRVGHWQFDLPAFILDRLRALELAAVEDLAVDTYTHADRFFSYRRATHRTEPDYGRQISAIVLP